MAGGEAADVDGVVGFVGADDLVGIAGGFGQRIFADPWAWCGARGDTAIDAGSLWLVRGGGVDRLRWVGRIRNEVRCGRRLWWRAGVEGERGDRKGNSVNGVGHDGRAHVDSCENIIPQSNSGAKWKFYAIGKANIARGRHRIRLGACARGLRDRSRP